MFSTKELLIKKGIASMKISMRIVTLAVLALCMALFTTNAFAQSSTTGSIEGDVVDVNGAAVPGVTVIVSSPNLITPQSSTTDDNGHYRILNLPPGRYTVVVEAVKGFAKYETQNVEVNLSRTSSVEVRLQPESVGGTVNITDTSGAAVDVASNTAGTNVSTDQFSNFPTTRTVQGLYTIAPTVTRSGLRDASGRERDPSVAGSSGPENNYILDGVNTTDPAFGGSGANLPFEFVQEVEIKTGAYGAEYGRATGGIFNVITKSGGNEIRGDAFAFFTTKSLVRQTKNFPDTGSAPNGFSEIDAGFDIGGPIKKDKLWFFGAFNPQRRTNFYLTQSLRVPVQNKVTTPFYAGKITWAINQQNIFTASTFGDFTKIQGFLATGALTNVSGYGANPIDFQGTQETGGHNYSFRLNSTITPTWVGEFLFGLHFQRANTIPEEGLNTPLVTDAFSILRGNGTVAGVTQTGVNFGGTTGNLDYVFSPGGSLQRNFVRQGWGLYAFQDRNRYEAAARLQNIWGPHTIKYGFEWFRNKYIINQDSTGPNQTFGNPLGLVSGTGDINNDRATTGFRVTNSFFVCTTRVIGGNLTLVCPNATSGARAAALVATPGFAAATGITGGSTVGALSQAEFFNNPFLIRSTTRVRDFSLIAGTYTDVESAYIQDDYKISKDVQFNIGLRWDFQQAYGNDGVSYLKLNDFKDNLQPRVGLIWDFTGQGKGKLFVNFARFLETPLPLDLNVRAGSDNTQTDKNFNVNQYAAPNGSFVIPGIDGDLTIGTVNLGAEHTPIDPDLKPQTVNEVTAGIEYEVMKDIALGARGIYRTQGSVIEDGSFNNGNTYFIFNPGESQTDQVAKTRPETGFNGFGRARRYYRAVEFTATKRFSNNYQFIASYVFSSLIGNYEGLFRNDNGQSDPNITSLFDLVSLLANTYGRLPNDRPHQFKFNGSYQTPWKLMISGNFYAQSGIPFNQLIPHPVYGNNEGFAVPRGTAVLPSNQPGGISGGRTRGPTTMNLDLGLYYPIQFGENRQLRLQADWFNVFNSQRALTLDQTFSINSGASGVPPVPNPFYGRGLIYQFPSSFRFGVKFQF
jgi:outer membrane receptor protein involved in Fe transport